MLLGTSPTEKNTNTSAGELASLTKSLTAQRFRLDSAPTSL